MENRTKNCLNIFIGGNGERIKLRKRKILFIYTKSCFNLFFSLKQKEKQKTKPIVRYCTILNLLDLKRIKINYIKETSLITVESIIIIQ